jgi:GntR family transcriptional regulator|nr:GntR family transcriptional regulator [Anaerocolumna jejuensis]
MKFSIDKELLKAYIVYIEYIQYNEQGEQQVDIIISNSSGKPIYEQITMQIKNMIMSGELRPGDSLPSMRLLAKELRISVITTKRAYEDLERDGFITTLVGKGSFVSETNTEIMKEEQYRTIEEFLQKAAEIAKKSGIKLEELHQILDMIFKED